MARLGIAFLLLAVIGVGVGFAVWWLYDPQIVLDYEKQVLIWDAESATFQIETRFGKRRFVKALRDNNRDLLASCFRDEFAAKLVNEEAPLVRTVSTVSETRYDRGKASQRETDANGLIDWLFAQLEPFAEVQSASQRVLEIHPIEQISEDTGRWSIRFLHMFYGTTAEGGRIAHESEHDVVLEYTARDQLETDPVVISWDTIYFKNSTATHPLMEEVTEQFGLKLDSRLLEDNWEIPVENNLQQKICAAVEDFDRDGYLDIAVASMVSSREKGVPVLLRNVGGERFENVTQQMGIREWDATIDNVQFSAAWIDYNNDGYPDLIFGESLYRNEQGERFTDVTAESGLKVQREPMGITVADYNLDGFPDLYILYQSPPTNLEMRELANVPMPWIGDNKFGAENHLWLNDGNGHFKLIDNANAGGGKGSSFAASWFHLDDDLDPDLYIVNDFGNNVLLRNKGDGTFEDITEETQTGGFATSMGVASGDINNDGTVELYVGDMYSKMGRRIIAPVSHAD